MPSKLTFLNIKEGCGKTFSLSPQDTSKSTQAADQDQNQPILFGTRNCYTCVGLFIPIPSKHRAYVAHINAWVKHHSKTSSPTYHHTASELEGEHLKTEVSTRLHTLFSKNGWTKSMIDPSTIILLCPQLDFGGSWKTSVGAWVVAGIKAFFGSRLKKVDEWAHGFIFDPIQGRLIKLPCDNFQDSWRKTDRWEQEVEGGEKTEITAVDAEAQDVDWEIEAFRSPEEAEER